MNKQNTIASRTQTQSSKARTAVKAAAHSAAFEALEDRKLFSALTVTGTGLDDVIRINHTGAAISVNVNGVNHMYPSYKFTDITVNALGGNDRVLATSWTGKPITVNAGAGNDYMVGGKANDTFNGGDGDDVMMCGRGSDEFNGGLGTDTADYSATGVGINVTLDDVANDGMPSEGDNVRSDVENVNGGMGNDTITGSSANNYLQGGGGTDTLRGMDGNDVLDGGLGGAFPVSRNTGNDLLYGGAGNDVLHASDYGNNTLSGEAGDDTLYGYNGADTLYGGSGRDACYGGNNNDLIYGNTGDDYLDGQDGVDKVYGNSGPQPARIILNPLPVLKAGASAGGGITDGTSNTIILPPIDVNPLPIPLPLPTDNVLIRPVPHPVLPEIDMTPRIALPDIRLVDPIFTLPPVIFIESDNDVVHGGDGNDRVRGDGGDDQVFGDDGDDFCYGDAGNDVVRGGAGEDHVYGGAGDDQLFGDDGDDVLVSIGGGQNDQNTGGAGFDSVWLDAEATELDHNDFFDALFEGAGGNHHRVAGFEQLRTSDVVTNATLATQTPSRELNGQNLLDPVTGASYQTFSDRPLFGAGGPHKDDVDQGNLADCYYLAGLSAVAKQNANRIKQSVVDLGDGTYAVQLFRGGAAEFWRVDGQLPVNGAGNPAYAGLGHDDALWVAIMEKAFAFSRSNRGTYASAEWGGTDAFNVLNLSNSGIGRANAIDALKNIKARLDGNQAVITWTPGQADIPSDCPCVGSHMYSVERVDLTTLHLPFGGDIVIGGTITVRNPWATDGGGNSDGANDGYVTLTADQYFRGFAGAWSAVV